MSSEAGRRELRTILNSIFTSDLSGSDKRMMYRYTVLVAVGGHTAVQRSESEYVVLDRMEDALVAAGGGHKIPVSDAKKILRERGAEGKLLASRLGRLSKTRNGKAHPDTSISAEIRTFLEQVPADIISSGKNGEQSEQVSEESETQEQVAEQVGNGTQRFALSSGLTSAAPSTIDPFEHF